MRDPCILIVEQDVFVRTPLAEYHRECGYLVLEASSAGEANRTLWNSGNYSHPRLVLAQRVPTAIPFSLRSAEADDTAVTAQMQQILDAYVKERGPIEGLSSATLRIPSLAKDPHPVAAKNLRGRPPRPHQSQFPEARRAPSSDPLFSARHTEAGAACEPCQSDLFAN
jgi:hypothetical protein